jgi:hypothetical protein
MTGGPVTWTRYTLRTVVSVPLYIQVLITSLELVVFLGAATGVLAQTLAQLPYWLSASTAGLSIGLDLAARLYDRVWYLITEARRQGRQFMQLSHNMLSYVHLFWRALATVRAWQRRFWLPSYWSAKRSRNEALMASAWRRYWQPREAGATGGGGGGSLVRLPRYTRVPLGSGNQASVLYLELNSPVALSEARHSNLSR